MVDSNFIKHHSCIKVLLIAQPGLNLKSGKQIIKTFKYSVAAVPIYFIFIAIFRTFVK